MNKPMIGAAVAVWLFWTGGQHSIAAGIAVLGVAVYAVQILWFPLVECGRCDGKGKIDNPLGKGHRPCGRCERKREHPRWGRRVWDKRTKG